MANYKQISKGNWKAQISFGFIDGKRKIVAKQGFKTKKDAEKWANEIENKNFKGYITPNSSTLIFSDFIQKWYNEHKIMSLGITTRASYIGRINTHIIPKLGNYKLKDISTIIIQDFYNSLISNNMKPSSAKKVMDILVSCFTYAKKNKLIYELPTYIDKIKSEKPKISFWDKEEIDFFLNKISDHYLYTPVFIDLLTGLRIGELCGLRWCDFDAENGYLNIVGQVIYDILGKKIIYTPILKTDTSFRKVSIPPLLIDFLNSLKKKVNPKNNDFIILDRDGSMCCPRNLSMNFTKTVSKYKKSIDEMEKLGKNIDDYMQLKQITFHGLRHTHATLLILHGENVKVVSNRLGHKDITTTLNTYTHIMDDMKQNTAALLQDVFC